MIKIYPLAFFICFHTSLSGQINKGSYLLGGQITYTSATAESNEITEYRSKGASLIFSLGKAFKENTVFGINLIYAPFKYRSYSSIGLSSTIRDNSYGIGPYYRKYKTLGKGFYFFGELDAIFQIRSLEQDYTSSTADNEQRSLSGAISLTPGFSYQVSKKLLIELVIPRLASIQYVASKFESEDPALADRKSQDFQFSSRLSNTTGLGYVGVGFRFIL